MKSAKDLVVQEEIYQIRTYEIDNRKVATVPALVKLMHEAAMQNVIDLGVSVWDLEPHHLSWVLMRKALRINRLPTLGETIRVVTYPAGFERLLTYRDYKVYDETGDLLAHSSSTWVLMNTQARMLARIPDFILDFRRTMPPEEEFLARPVTKLPQLETADYRKHFQVNWHDLDFNQHLNNIYYVQWMLETLPITLLANGKLKALDIHYKAESLFGDELISESVKLPDQDSGDALFLHLLKRVSDGKELAAARTEWGE